MLQMVKINVSGLPMPSLSISEGLRNTASNIATPQPVSTPAHPSRPASAMSNMDEVSERTAILLYSALSCCAVGHWFPFSILN